MSLLCTQDILLVKLNPTIELSFRLLIIFCIFLLVMNSTDKAGEIGTLVRTDYTGYEMILDKK